MGCWRSLFARKQSNEIFLKHDNIPRATARQQSIAIRVIRVPKTARLVDERICEDLIGCAFAGKLLNNRAGEIGKATGALGSD